MLVEPALVLRTFARLNPSEPRLANHRKCLTAAFFTADLICPSCQCVAVDLISKSVAESTLSRSRKEGRFAVVTNVGSGMRWTRVVQKTNAPNADGEAAWSRYLDADINLVTMLRIAPGMVTKSPITRESAEETVKTIRAGKAGDFR
jgi:hypothetical protein